MVILKMIKMCLCDNCENRENDKCGFWCMALHDMKKHEKICPDYEPKYKQLNIQDIEDYRSV